MPAYGIYVRQVRGVIFQNVRTSLVKADARSMTIFIDVENIKPMDFAAKVPDLK